MDEKSTIKDLEAQAKNTSYLVDRLNRAAYWMTFAELLRLLGGTKEKGEE